MTDLNILCVCTHNRARSVLMAAVLRDELARAGARAEVSTAGFRDEGLPPTEMTLRLLAARGLDVSEHRSRRVSAELVHRADLILTAERDHVVRIVASDRDTFRRTFTLPELVTRTTRAAAPTTRRPIAHWLHEANSGRPRGADYLTAPVPEVLDPSGRSPADWDAVLQEIDAWCGHLARLASQTSGREW